MSRKATLGTDARGTFRRYLGWKLSGDKPIQHLFRLGSKPSAAHLANLRLEALWEAIEARWERLRSEGRAEGIRPLWDDVTLKIAKAIAKGAPDCPISPPPDVAGLSPEMVITWLARLQADFPVLPLRLEQEDVYVHGVGGIRQIIEVKKELLSTLGEPTTTQTLHQALAAYSAYVGEKYQDKPSRRPIQTTISLLRKQSEDYSLERLDADKIETWLAYWCRRPIGAKGRALAPTTCRNALIGMRQFLRWLSRSRQFDWQMPGGFSFPRCKIARVPAEQVRRRNYFKPEELKTIWSYAHPWDRALILLALNCGFSKAEIATLHPAEIVQVGKHSFIKRHRRKTGAYAEWILWPETLAALEFLAMFRDGGFFAVVNQAGKRLDRGSPSGNENQTIKNHWDRIFRRLLNDHPDHIRLPFKHLRKTGATLLRHLKVENAAELASMYLSHGESSDHQDSLLPVYTSRPWRKLHKALVKLRRKLLPVLTSVEQPFGPPRQP